MTLDDRESLLAKIAELEKSLVDSKGQIDKLQKASRATEISDAPVTIGEFEDTLKRLVQRVAMILQAEKCVIMIRDKQGGEIIAKNPAFGLTDTDVAELRVQSEEGIVGDRKSVV